MSRCSASISCGSIISVRWILVTHLRSKASSYPNCKIRNLRFTETFPNLHLVEHPARYPLSSSPIYVDARTREGMVRTPRKFLGDFHERWRSIQSIQARMREAEGLSSQKVLPGW